MPYVNIKITNEGATPEQKAELIAGATKLLADVLDKNPATTFVVIDEVEARREAGAREVGRTPERTAVLVGHARVEHGHGGAVAPRHAPGLGDLNERQVPLVLEQGVVRRFDRRGRGRRGRHRREQ